MPVTVGAFTALFSQINDFLELFEGASDAEDVQAILHKIADDNAQEFIDTINYLRQSVAQLGRSEMSAQVVNYQGPLSPGETFLHGQEAAADIARTLDLDAAADDIDALDPPTSFPFDEAGKRLLDYSDGLARAATTVKARATATIVGEAPPDPKLAGFADRLEALAVFHRKQP
jgi:hypothetical protein